MGFVGLAMAVVMVVVVDFGCGGFGWVIFDVFWLWLYLVLAPVGCRGGGLLGLWLFAVVIKVGLWWWFFFFFFF